MNSVVITVFVRHTPGCKYDGDEFARRCKCRKHLRWTANGKQHRKTAGTRSWAEAETVKRGIEDQLSGRAVDKPEANDIGNCIEVFLTDKRVQGLTKDGIGKYTRELHRMKDYCEHSGVYTVQAITRELLTNFCGTWEEKYPSSYTRSKLRERYRGFFRYCFEAQWIERIPSLPKIKVDMAPTLPLTAEQFDHLLASIPVGLPHAQAERKRVRVRALFLLMRWSGLSILDALTLPKAGLRKAGGFYRVTTKRQKTGVDVCVPVPAAVVEELLALDLDDPRYFFWSGNGDPANFATKFQVRCVAPVFKAAGLYGEGHMVSHRLRDTFAVDLLEKGVPLEEVSKALGHESIRTTEKHYASWIKGRQDRLDSLITGSWAVA
jgi:integrase/recombinase XerD